MPNSKCKHWRNSNKTTRQQNIEQLDQRLRNQASLKQTLNSLHQRKTILLGEQEKISLRYDQLKQLEQESFSQSREQGFRLNSNTYATIMNNAYTT